MCWGQVHHPLPAWVELGPPCLPRFEPTENGHVPVMDNRNSLFVTLDLAKGPAGAKERGPPCHTEVLMLCRKITTMKRQQLTSGKSSARETQGIGQCSPLGHPHVGQVMG